MNLFGIGRKLIDPRTYDKGVNQEKKVRALKWWEDDTMSPAIPEVKSIEEYVQKGRQVPVVSSIVDRSKTDSLITNINDIELSRPVEIQGGTNFMFKYPDSLFANQEAIARRHLNTAKTLEEQFGVPPLFAPNLMSPSGSDFMTGSAELAMSHAFETLDAASKRELDDFIRKKGFDVTKKRKLANGKEESYIKNYKLENWHGIDDPRSIDQLRNAPADLRKEIVKKFGTKNFFGPEGFLAPGEIRTMITQDDLMNARDSTFTNIGVFNTAEGLKPSNHWSYSHMFPGQGDARLIEAGNIGIYDFDTILKAGKGGKIVPFTKSDGTLRKPADPRNPSSKDLTAVGKNITIGILDEAQLEKWKALGIVGVPGLTAAGLSLASEPKLPEFLDRINNPQDHPYIINPDGSVSTHLMANSRDRFGNPIVFPLIQSDKDGNLKSYRNDDGSFDFNAAQENAERTGNYLVMKDDDAALNFAMNYKTGTPLESFNPMKLQSEDYMNARLNNNYAEVRKAPRGPISGMLADAFMGAKEYLNEMPNVAEFFKEAFGGGFGAEIAGAQGRAPTFENVNVPLGDIMLGETPEAINQLSYGLTPSAEQTLDLALTAGGGLAGAAKGAVKAGKSFGLLN